VASVNKVIVLGNVGKDPETRTFPDGGQVTNVTLATTEKWKDKQSGEMREATEWHRIAFHGRLAEIAAQYIVKGSPIYVEGSLHTRKWTDQAGVEKYSTEIKAASLQFLGARPQRPDQGGQDSYDTPEPRQQQQRQAPPPPRQQPRQPAPRPTAPPAGSGFDDMDDDIPFASSCMSHDMLTSKAKRMARYDY
jgi:single-strand DNA-binding protein